ncbi:MAG TPA: NfeD family protein [Dongiaceae bacterium]|nr:NfeD family protein [Dongiaceae bacterium]
MIDWLNTHLAYWHWIVAGLLLAGLEVFVPSFVLLWFGASAVVVGLLMLLVPLGVTVQLFLWVTLSVVFVALWHKFVSPRMRDRTLAGMSREAIIGQAGIVIRHDASSGRGLLKFPAPIMGSDEWNFICEGKLVSGDRVTVTELSGNSVIVRPQR